MLTAPNAQFSEVTPCSSQANHSAQSKHRTGHGSVEHVVLFVFGGVDGSDIDNLFARGESERAPNYDCNSDDYKYSR